MDRSDPKRSVSFPITVWYSDETGHIHISRPTSAGFSTTINGDPGSARGHVHLYRKLAEALRDGGVNGPDTSLRIKKS